MKTNSTAGQTAKAAIWLIVGRIATRLIDLITFIILARVLGPAEFGVVALAMIPIYIVEMVTDLPISNALIRTETFSKNALDTAFTLSVLRGVVIAIILLSVAVPFAHYSDDLRVAPLVAALSIGSMFRCLSSPAAIRFVRELDFRREIAMDSLGKLASFASSVAFALSTQSYWAIAVGTLTGPLISTILSYYFAPYKPRISLGDWPVFSNLAGWHSLGQLVSAISWQSDRIILTRYISLGEFGRYSVAENLTGIIHSIVTVPLARAWLPSFSSVQDDGHRLRQAYIKASSASAMIVVPAYLGLSVMSGSVVKLVLGYKWLEAAPILAAIAGGAIFSVVNGPVSSLALTLNRARFATLLVTADVVFKLPALVIATMWFGVTGALIARGVAAFVSLVTGMFIVHSLTRLQFKKQIGAIIRPYAAGAIMYLSLIPIAEWAGDLPIGLTLIATSGGAILLGVAIYTSSILILWFIMGQSSGPEAMLLNQIGSKMKMGFSPREIVDDTYAESVGNVLSLTVALADQILQMDAMRVTLDTHRCRVLVNAAQCLRDFDVSWPPVLQEAMYKAVNHMATIDGD